MGVAPYRSVYVLLIIFWEIGDMMQFLKARGRQQSQFDEECSDRATSSISIDDSAEDAVLSDLEAAEIQQAFQHQSLSGASLEDLEAAMEAVEPVSPATDVVVADSEMSVAASSSVYVSETVDGEHVELDADPSDLSSFNASDLDDVPELLAPADPAALPMTPAMAVVAESGTMLAEFADVSEADVSVEESLDRLSETCTDVSDLAVQDNVAADLLDVTPIVPSDDVTGEVATDDIGSDESDESAAYDRCQTGPLTYFQYYLNENSGADGATDSPAPYVTPWHQPSVPGGLIGAGVLGATLVSGFMIADTVKMPPLTTAKRPVTPSPLKSLSPSTQTTAMAIPQALPPEALQPESTTTSLKLPAPKQTTPAKRIFPPLGPTLGQSSSTLPLAVAAAPSVAQTAPLPQSNAVVRTPELGVAKTAPPSKLRVDADSSGLESDPLRQPLAQPQKLTPPPTLDSPPESVRKLPELQPTEVISMPFPAPNDITPNDINGSADRLEPVATPSMSSGEQPLANPTDITQPQRLPDGSALGQAPGANPDQTLPALTPTPVGSKLESAPSATQPSPVAATTPAPKANSPLSATSSEAAKPAAPVVPAQSEMPTNIVVPTESMQAAVAPTTPKAAFPQERVFNRETVPAKPTAVSSAATPLSSTASPIAELSVGSQAAPTAPAAPAPAAPSVMPAAVPAVSQPLSDTPLPPQQAAQPIANRLNIAPQVQQLLATPQNLGYQETANQWRNLTKQEALLVMQAPQLASFTRQQLTQQSYIQAYQAVSEQTDALPPYGFIDYQRRLILLPPQSAAAWQPDVPAQSRYPQWRSVVAQQSVTL